MIKISKIVREIIDNDDLIRSIAHRNIINNRAYAREIKKEVEEKTYKKVKLGSISTAISRYIKKSEPIKIPSEDDIKQISVQTNLAGITYERSDKLSNKIRNTYKNLEMKSKTYITITQGINEITIIAEENIVNIFRNQLQEITPIYDINKLIGITLKFDLKYLKTPNLFYAFIRKLALQNINIIEIVSTATELTFLLDKNDMQPALTCLQKDL